MAIPPNNNDDLFQIKKNVLIDTDWHSLYQSLNNDSKLVANFIKNAGKEVGIKPQDLDNTILEIGSKIKKYIEVSSSGSIKLF